MGSRKQAASRASCAGGAAQPVLLVLLPDVQMCKKLLEVGKEKSLASDSTPNVGSEDRDSSLLNTNLLLPHLAPKQRLISCTS